MSIDYNRIARAIVHFKTHGFKKEDGLDAHSLYEKMKIGTRLYSGLHSNGKGITLHIMKVNDITETKNMTESEYKYFENDVHYDLMAMVRATKVFFNHENVQTNIKESGKFKVELLDKLTNKVLAEFDYIRNTNCTEVLYGKILSEPEFSVLTLK